MEDAAQHVGADMAQRILSGGPDLDQLAKGPQSLPVPCACGAPPAGPKEHGHHDIHATAPGPDAGAGDSDVDSPKAPAVPVMAAGISVV